MLSKLLNQKRLIRTLLPSECADIVKQPSLWSSTCRRSTLTGNVNPLSVGVSKTSSLISEVAPSHSVNRWLILLQEDSPYSAIVMQALILSSFCFRYSRCSSTLFLCSNITFSTAINGKTGIIKSKDLIRWTSLKIPSKIWISPITTLTLQMLANIRNKRISMMT